MYMSQEMPNLRRFLALAMSGDNRMTIILEYYYAVSIKVIIAIIMAPIDINWLLFV